MNAPVPSGPVCRSASIRILIIFLGPDDTTARAPSDVRRGGRAGRVFHRAFPSGSPTPHQSRFIICTLRISPHLPPPGFRRRGVCWRGRPSAFSPRARRRTPLDAFPPRSVEWISPDGTRAHLPALAVSAMGDGARMMTAPVASPGDMEFPKNSINSGKI